MYKADDENLLLFSSGFVKQKEYWSNKLSGDIKETRMLVDHAKEHVSPDHKEDKQRMEISIPGDLCAQLMKLTKNSDLSIYIVLLTVLKSLIYRYSDNDDITVLSPVYKQKITEETINHCLFIRDWIDAHVTFKELILRIRETTLEAYENQDYPFDRLMEYLFITPGDEENRSDSISDIACILKNIHDEKDIQMIKSSLAFCFERNEQRVNGEIVYEPRLYETSYIHQIKKYFINILEKSLPGPDSKISGISFLPGEEKKRLIFDLNDTKAGYPKDRTIIELFERQVEKTPGNIAVLYEDRQLNYRRLNEEANRTARKLKEKGVTANHVAVVMIDPSPEMIIGITAVLKAGGAFLPIDPNIPVNRIRYMLGDSQPSILLTGDATVENHSLKDLQAPQSVEAKVHVSAPRSPINDFDRMPMPDRSLIDYEKYSPYIGQASVKNSISLQASRGCPYKCAYCHKIWPKKQVIRSAENIFQEIQFNYNIGIRRFSFVDDVFNLNKKNSSRFFELIINSDLDVQLLFPNGVRGDILTGEYIDLMVEAGTIEIGMALESASPRLQKLIGKNLNLEKFRKNVEYTCKKHPQLILRFYTMHGFPTETEEEAEMTLEFIKSQEWIDFPSINILKIFPNTDMEKLAVEHGIDKKAIEKSTNFAYYELPETLPFDKSFTAEYQTRFLNEYFLLKERLLNVLPHQMKLLSEDEMVKRYKSFLPTRFENFDELLEVLNVSKDELGEQGVENCRDKDNVSIPNLNKKMRMHFPKKESSKNAFRVLLLDLSQFFSDDRRVLYDVYEPPLGLMYLLTYLNRQFGGKINGRIAKSRIDFDSYRELKAILEEFEPQVIGIRTLTFYKDFFHKTIAMIKKWRIDVPIIGGGPYATSDYQTILQEPGVDLIVLGEGEITFSEIIREMMENDGKLPKDDVLKEIRGIAFVPGKQEEREAFPREIIAMDEGNKVSSTNPGKNLETINQPTDLLYVIYTSGTTGKPKGVLITHQNLVNYTNWFINLIDVNRADKAILTSSFAFDALYTQLFASFLKGCELHMISRETLINPQKLLNYIRKNGITYIKVTPSLFNIMVNSPDFSAAMFENLRFIMLGGEPINIKDVEKVHAVCPHIKIMNHYGPTETTIGSIAQFIEFDQFQEYKVNSTIGKPIDNTQVYILDKHLQLVPPGVPGELAIAGDGVGIGYLNRLELTHEKFIGQVTGAGDRCRWENKTNKKFLRGSRGQFLQKAPPGRRRQKIYKTGDLARWEPDGNIKLLGRMDTQIKLRGYRIELEEIEKHLLSINHIKEVVVIDREAANGDKHLCAYIVSGKESRVPELREYLEKELPDYMIPSYFVHLEKIPLTAHNKIDYGALPQPKDIMDTGAAYEAPANKVEEKIAQTWAEVLEMDPKKLGRNDNFFDLGGNSFNILKVLNRLNQKFDQDIALGNLFLYSTLKELAANIFEERLLNKLECIVKLNDGQNEKNIFIIHPLHGMVYQYKMLAKVLENDYNVYGIQVRGLVRRSKFPETLEIMVTDYVNQVLQIQPEGPFQIVGFCFGNMIGYNLVKLLEDLNHTVKKFIMLDEESFIPPFLIRHYRMKDTLKKILKPVKHLLARKNKPGDAARRNFEKIVQEIEANEVTHKNEAAISPEEAGERKAKAKINIQKLVKKYGQGSPYQDRLLGLIHAPLVNVNAVQSDYRIDWKELSGMTYGESSSVDIDAAHNSMFESPHVEKLAALIKEALQDKPQSKK